MAENLHAAPSAGSSTRVLIVVNLTDASIETVSQALNLSLPDASLRIRRGGYQLLRVMPPTEGEALVADLRQRGLRAWSLPGEQIDESQPIVIRGGSVASGCFLSAERSQELRVGEADLLLAIWGRIHRERQAPTHSGGLRYRTASSVALEDELRLHLHRHLDPRPLEIDPGAFEFTETEAPTESSLLRIRTQLESLAGTLPHDEDFRFEPPALAPAQAQRLGRFALVEALEATRTGRRDRAAGVLHNLKQFRFYSAWRGTLERLLQRD